MNNWLPIDEAPRDRDVLLTDGVDVAIGYYHSSGYWDWLDIMSKFNPPTHYMLLPAPPRRHLSENDTP